MMTSQERAQRVAAANRLDHERISAGIPITLEQAEFLATNPVYLWFRDKAIDLEEEVGRLRKKLGKIEIS